MRKSTKLEDVEKVRKIVSESFSIREVRIKLGYKESGGVYVLLRGFFTKHKINVDHFQPIWNKGKTRFSDARLERKAKSLELPWDEVFCYNSNVSNAHILKRLIISGKRKYECEHCKLSFWNGKPIRLQIDHKNGDRLDCSESNLAIICPNCHSQTETFSRGLKSKSTNCPWWHKVSNQKCSCSPTGTRRIVEVDKVGGSSPLMSTKDESWRKKPRFSQRKVERPSRDMLLKMLETMSWTAIGKKYGVSDNAVRKWLK